MTTGIPGPAVRGRNLRTLSPAECFDLLTPGGVGRVAFMTVNGIEVLPVNYVVAGKTIVFRTAPDTLLAVFANAQASFEADRFDEERREGWSVLIQGHAHRLTAEQEVSQIEDRTHLEPWAAGARDVFVRVAPIRISGRRLIPAPAGRAAPGS